MSETLTISINGSKHTIKAFLKKETTKAVCFESEYNVVCWFPKSLVTFTNDFFASSRVVNNSRGVLNIIDEKKKIFFGAL